MRALEAVELALDAASAACLALARLKASIRCSSRAHLFVVGDHPFVEVGRPSDGNQLVFEDRFQAPLPGRRDRDDAPLVGAEPGAFPEGVQCLGEVGA